MKVVILAGGYGTRLSEMTNKIPKPMVQIGEQPILWHIMKHYAHFGFSEFVLCLGYKSDVIRDYFFRMSQNMSDTTINLQTGETITHKNIFEPWKVTLVNTGINTGTAGRLLKVKEYLGNETFAMTYGDGVSDINLQELLQCHKAQKRLVTVSAINQPSRYGIIRSTGNIVDSFDEKPEVCDSARINAGFFMIEPKALDYISGEETMWEDKPMKQLVADRQLSVFEHDGFWQCMDTLRDANKLEALWATGEAPWKCWA